MSNDDPWAIQPKESKVHYAQCQVVREERQGGNGNTFYQMQFFLTPIDPTKNIIESKFFNFSPEFQKIIIPSLMKLVSAGRLTSPADLENGNPFVAFKWTEYKSYEQRDITYWQEKNPDKLSVDDKGRTYKGKLAIEFVDAFPDETSWRQASESDEPTEQQSLPTETTVTKTDNQSDAILEAIPTIVQSCGADMKKLTETLSHPPFNSFKIDSPEIKMAVAKMVNDKCGADIIKQATMLAEINSHFDEAYLTPDSQEALALGEVRLARI